MLVLQLSIGMVLILLTVILHAVALDYIIKNTNRLQRMIVRRTRFFWKAAIISFAVLGVFGALVAEIWVWAGFFLFIDALGTLEEALYFSTVCFTTLGFGDIIIAQEWRMMSAIEAANGLLLASWSAAFIFEVMVNLYRHEGESIRSR